MGRKRNKIYRGFFPTFPRGTFEFNDGKGDTIYVKNSCFFTNVFIPCPSTMMYVLLSEVHVQQKTQSFINFMCS